MKLSLLPLQPLPKTVEDISRVVMRQSEDAPDEDFCSVEFLAVLRRNIGWESRHFGRDAALLREVVTRAPKGIIFVVWTDGGFPE